MSSAHPLGEPQPGSSSPPGQSLLWGWSSALSSLIYTLLPWGSCCREEISGIFGSLFSQGGCFSSVATLSPSSSSHLGPP